MMTSEEWWIEEFKKFLGPETYKAYEYYLLKEGRVLSIERLARGLGEDKNWQHFVARPFTWNNTKESYEFWKAINDGWKDRVAYIKSAKAVTPKDKVKTEEKALEIQHGGNHYKDMKIQPIEFIHANNIDYLAGNVIKYIVRHKKKNGLEDVKKALHYCQLIIEMEYKDE